MKQKVKFISLALVLVLALTSVSDSWSRGRRGRRRGRRFRKSPYGLMIRVLSNPRALKRIGITQAKANSIKVILRNAKKQAIKIKADLKINHINIRAEYDKTRLNANRILALSKKSHNLIWELRKIKILTRVKIANLLTKQQRFQLRKEIRRKFFRKYRNHRRGRRGRRGSRRGR